MALWRPWLGWTSLTPSEGVGKCRKTRHLPKECSMQNPLTVCKSPLRPSTSSSHSTRLPYSAGLSQLTCPTQIACLACQAPQTPYESVSATYYTSDWKQVDSLDTQYNRLPVQSPCLFYYNSCIWLSYKHLAPKHRNRLAWEKEPDRLTPGLTPALQCFLT